MKGWPAAVFVALALLRPVLAAGAPDFAALSIQRYDAPKAAPAFTLPDLDGKKVRGTRDASSELLMHLEVYRSRADVR